MPEMRDPPTKAEIESLLMQRHQYNRTIVQGELDRMDTQNNRENDGLGECYLTGVRAKVYPTDFTICPTCANHFVKTRGPLNVIDKRIRTLRHACDYCGSLDRSSLKVRMNLCHTASMRVQRRVEEHKNDKLEAIKKEEFNRLVKHSRDRHVQGKTN